MKKCKCFSSPQYHRDDCEIYDVHGKPKPQACSLPRSFRTIQIDPEMEARLEEFERLLDEDNSSLSSPTTHLVLRVRKINDAANN